MTQITFTSANGKDQITVEAQPGARLLDIAQAHDQPLEGTCEGQMACSTCHVIIDKGDFFKLPPATEMEEDMLDLAASVMPTSRLACQIFIDASWEKLGVRIPSESRNMQDI